MHSETYTWNTSSSGNLFFATNAITDDSGNPTAVNKEITQTVDQYGNLESMANFL